MSKKNSYQKEMKAYAKNSSSRHLDILRQSELSTFEINEHNMQVEAYPNTFSALSGEIVALEKAELVDHFELERKYGRTDKKRWNLLCWP